MLGFGWMYWGVGVSEMSRMGKGGEHTMCGLLGTVDTARRVAGLVGNTRVLLRIRRGANVVVDMLKGM